MPSTASRWAQRSDHLTLSNRSLVLLGYNQPQHEPTSLSWRQERMPIVYNAVCGCWWQWGVQVWKIVWSTILSNPHISLSVIGPQKLQWLILHVCVKQNTKSILWLFNWKNTNFVSCFYLPSRPSAFLNCYFFFFFCGNAYIFNAK